MLRVRTLYDGETAISRQFCALDTPQFGSSPRAFMRWFVFERFTLATKRTMSWSVANQCRGVERGRDAVASRVR